MNSTYSRNEIQQSGTFYGVKFVKAQNINMYLSFTKNSDSHLYPYKYVCMLLYVYKLT